MSEEMQVPFKRLLIGSLAKRFFLLYVQIKRRYYWAIGKNVPCGNIEAFAGAVVLVPVSNQGLPREATCS